MCCEGGETALWAGPVFVALFLPPKGPAEPRLRAGRAEAGVARLSSASESATLEFADNDLLMRGSLEREGEGGARGERERLVFLAGGLQKSGSEERADRDSLKRSSGCEESDEEDKAGERGPPCPRGREEASEEEGSSWRWRGILDILESAAGGEGPAAGEEGREGGR